MHDAFNNCFGVFETCENFFCATVFFDKREFEGTIVAFFVNVRDSAHNWAHNYFGVIVEKVDNSNNFRCYSKFLFATIVLSLSVYYLFLIKILF